MRVLQRWVLWHGVLQRGAGGTGSGGPGSTSRKQVRTGPAGAWAAARQACRAAASSVASASSSALATSTSASGPVSAAAQRSATGTRAGRAPPARREQAPPLLCGRVPGGRVPDGLVPGSLVPGSLFLGSPVLGRRALGTGRGRVQPGPRGRVGQRVQRGGQQRPRRLAAGLARAAHRRHRPGQLGSPRRVRAGQHRAPGRDPALAGRAGGSRPRAGQQIPDRQQPPGGSRSRICSRPRTGSAVASPPEHGQDPAAGAQVGCEAGYGRPVDGRAPGDQVGGRGLGRRAIHRIQGGQEGERGGGIERQHGDPPAAERGAAPAARAALVRALVPIQTGLAGSAPGTPGTRARRRQPEGQFVPRPPCWPGPGDLRRAGRARRPGRPDRPRRGAAGAPAKTGRLRSLQAGRQRGVLRPQAERIPRPDAVDDQHARHSSLGPTRPRLLPTDGSNHRGQP